MTERWNREGTLGWAPRTLSETQLAALSMIASAINDLRPAGFFLAGPNRSGKSTALHTIAGLSSTQGNAPELLGDSYISRERVGAIREVFRHHRLATCTVSLLAQQERPLRDIIAVSVRRSYPRLLPQETGLIDEPEAIKAGLCLGNHDMLLLLVDELSAFLNAKESLAATTDLLFLQDLGELISQGALPIVVVWAMGENITAISETPSTLGAQLVATYAMLSLHLEGVLNPHHSPPELIPSIQHESFESRLETAAAYFEEANSRNPSATWTNHNLIYARLALAEHRKALATARLAFLTGQFERALHLYDRILALDPGNHSAREHQRTAALKAHFYVGCEQDRRWTRALEEYQELLDALEGDPTNTILAEAKFEARAVAIARLASQAESAEAKGQLAEAQRCYEAILSIAPEQTDISAHLKSAIERQSEESDPRKHIPSHDEQRREIRKADSDEMAADRWDLELAQAASTMLHRMMVRSEWTFDPADPVRNLARLVGDYCLQEELDPYLEAKGIRGKTTDLKILELCVKEDPLEVVRDLIPAPRVMKLTNDLRLKIQADSPIEILRGALLQSLGFMLPRKPVGIGSRRETLSQLRGKLPLCDDRDGVIGIGMTACDDIGEPVLRDLIHFYCSELLGSDYQRQLAELSLVPARNRSGVNSLTFGQTIGLIERLNEYIEHQPRLCQQMSSWFGRNWIIDSDTHIERYLHPISPRRNHLSHPKGLPTVVLKQEAGEAVDMLCQLFQQLEDQMIYPPVIVVETRRLDRFGRVTYECIDDHGRPERVFTALELNVGSEYFLYPITNPIRVDPIIVEKQ